MFIATDDEMEDAWIDCFGIGVTYTRSRATKEPFMGIVFKKRFGADLILPSSFFKNTNVIISQMQSLVEKQLLLQCCSLDMK